MKQETSIEVKLNTSMLKNQLDTITKHITALKEELEELENNSCPSCNEKLTKSTLVVNGEEVGHTENCDKCGWNQ